MAFTDAEEAKLRTIITAFDEGQQVDDLPEGDTTVQDKEIEVFNGQSGVSERMSLTDAVNAVNTPYFGRVFNNNAASPKAVTWVGSLEFGRTLADQLGLGCYLVKNDHTRRKLDPTNHYKFSNGETAKLDGTMGHYMWGWNKKFYIAFPVVGGLMYEVVSLSPMKGWYNYEIPIGSMSAAGFAAMDRDSTTLVSYINNDAQYRGGNNTTSYDDTYRTLCGKPVTNMTAEEFRAAARKNGTGWLATTMRHMTVVKILFEIIFGTRNIQDTFATEKDADGLYQGGLGTGTTTWNGTKWNSYNAYNPFIPLSAGVELGDACGVSNYDVLDSDGSVVYTAPVPCFFGLKHPFGYLWRHMDDEFVKLNSDKTATHMVAPSLYGTWTIGSETGMVAYSTMPAGYGYIKTLSYDHLENFPTAFGGSETTYHCDQAWNNSGGTSGSRVVLRGCTADHAGNAGSSGLNANYVVSAAYAYVGVLLCEVAEDWLVEPVYAAAA